jgi:hypothetical protein
LLENEGYITRQVVSPTRYVKSLGFSNNQTLDFKTEWMCMALRVQRQRSALIELESIEEFSGKKTALLSDRCLLDELSYTSEAIGRTGTNTLLAFYNIARKFVEDDVVGFWDHVYYKPIHPEHLPVADGDRLGDVRYQKQVDYDMKTHFQEFKTDNWDILKLDRDEAVQQIYSSVKGEVGSEVDH